MKTARSCSFLPAATQMIYDMGLKDLLYGVTFECPPQALKEKEIIVRCTMEGQDLSSEEIDRIFSASKATGKSLYYVEEEKLQDILPDIIFTQDVCEICQIDTKCTAEAISKLTKQPELIPLNPQSFDDVFEIAVTIATALECEEAAYEYLSPLKEKIDLIVDTLRKHRAPLKRAMFMEWLSPIYNCGHWIPQQIAYAGGVDMLSNPNGDSIVTTWDKILRYDPDIIVIAPCGFHIDRAMEDMSKLTGLPNFSNLAATKNDQIFMLDYDLFTQPSPSTLTLGIEALAWSFHPDYFSLPEVLKKKVVKYSKLLSV